MLLTPADLPQEPSFEWRLRNSITRAFDARPEVTEAILAIDDARVREIVARNQTLPSLEARVDVAFIGQDGTVTGAAGDTGSYSAWAEDDGFVTTFVGLAFEMPIGNRRAEASLRQARLASRASNTVSEEKTAIRASGNSARASSSTRSTPGPMETRLSLAPQCGQAAGFGIEKPVKWQTSRPV